MPYSDIYLYSPLSRKTVKEGHNCALLLQFILSEMFHCTDSDKKNDPLEFVFSTPACFFPYDWSYEVGCLNKIEEHAQLLAHAFPKMEKAIDDFQTILTAILEEVIDRKKHREDIPHDELVEALSELYTRLAPFLIACKESENLVLFLLKNSEELNELAGPFTLKALLKKMFPDGSYEKLRKQYEERGFKSQLTDFDTLITHYER